MKNIRLNLLLLKIEEKESIPIADDFVQVSDGGHFLLSTFGAANSGCSNCGCNGATNTSCTNECCTATCKNTTCMEV
jgi:hypothetical protein